MEETQTQDVVEPQQPLADENVNENVNENQPEVSEVQPSDEPQAEVQAAEPTTPEVPVQEAEVEDEYVPTELPDIAPFDVSQLEVDENGQVDSQSFNQAVNQKIQEAIAVSTQTIRLELQEKQEWDKAIAAYPELKSDSNLRNLVHQLRAGSVIESNGQKYLSPKQAADRLMKIRGQAVAEGVKQAQTNTRIQESAYLETSATSTSPETSRRSNIKAQLNSGSYKEREDARKALLGDVAGKILQQQLNQ